MMIAQTMTRLPSLLSSSTLAAEESGWMKLWFRNTQGTFAEGVDWVFFFIFWVSTIFFVILMGMMVYFGVKYRRVKGQAPVPSASHNTLLELSWSVIPAILMAMMFYWGFKEYVVMRVPPGDAMEVYVTAKKWNWTLEYPNGAGSLESVSKSQEGRMLSGVDAPVFVLPANKPVKFIMTSEDVIHSFFIPEMRMKRDVFPNRYTTVWCEPTEITHRWDPELKHGVPIDGAKGLYLFCTEYCGDQHSQMLAEVQIMSDGDFRAWMAEQANTDAIDLLELGKILYKAQGCVACHTVDGGAGTGPTWKGIWDEARPGWTPQQGDGMFDPDDRSVVNLNYIHESIIDPGAYLREGYSNQMPTYNGKFKNREVRAIATYIKWLDSDFTAQAEQESADEAALREGGEATGGDEAGGE